MKIIFLVALIPVVLIRTESYVGAQQMMHYAPVNPHQGAQHMVRYAPVNPQQVAQHMIHQVPVNPRQGAQHMIRQAPVNPPQGAQHMIRQAPVNPPQGAQHMIRYAPVNAVQGGQHMRHNVQVNQVQGAQHMMHNVQVNPDHCRHGRNRRECFPGPYTYEYITAEYSVEREYPTESYVWPIRRTFCPRRYSWPCIHKVNECCSDNDCDPIQLCCFENCGNTCQFPVSFPTDGVRVKEQDPSCKIHPMFLTIVYAPPVKKG